MRDRDSRPRQAERSRSRTPPSPATSTPRPCSFCEDLSARKPSGIATHLNANKQGCVGKHTAAELLLRSVFRCGCGQFLTATPRGTQLSHTCAHSAARNTARAANTAADAATRRPHRPRYTASATARDCPLPRGCGKAHASFQALYGHIKSGPCGETLTAEDLRPMGIMRCGNTGVRGTCKALLETHTANTVREHMEICNFRDGGTGGVQVGEEAGPRITRDSWDLLEQAPLATLASAMGVSMGHIPKGLEAAVAECFTFAFTEAVTPATSERGFRLVMALPAMLLLRERGDGVSASVAVRQRVNDFLSGAWEKLLPTATGGAARPRMGPRGGHTTERDGTLRKRERVLSLIAEGEVSKSVQVLESPPMVTGQEDLERIQALHPPAGQHHPARDRGEGLVAMTLDRDLFNAYIADLPRARAPGTSQLRHSHIQSIVGAGGSDALYKLCNHILSGLVPTEIRPYFSGARLFALSKVGGGVRPIACGEVLRRMVASMAAKQLRAKIAAHFTPGPSGEGEAQVQRPAQFGVGISGGSDTMVHAVQAALQLQPSWAVVSIDWKNAFNTCSRAAMLEQVKIHFPELYPFVLACYDSDPLMLFRVEKEDGGEEMHTVPSCEGAQQGDPLGPLLFALALHPLLEATMREHPLLTMLPAYLDDTTIPGPPEEVARAFATMCRLGEAIGLEVNASKCKVYAPCVETDLSCFPEDVQGARGERLRGLVVLGVPIGDSDYVREMVFESMEKAALVLPSLNTLEDPQAAHILISQCVRPRIVFLLRGCEPSACTGPADSYHSKILEALAGPNAAVMPGPHLDAVGSKLAALPTRMGGGGMAAGSRIADAAFLASFALVFHQMTHLFPKVIGKNALTEATPGVGVLGAVAQAHARVTAEEDGVVARLQELEPDCLLPRGMRDRPTIPSLEEMQSGPLRGVQKQLSFVAAAADYFRLRALVMAGSESTKAWFASVTSPHSIGNAFMRCIPSYPAVTLEPAFYPVAARMYLFQDQPAMHGLTACNKCQRVTDPKAMHLLSCQPSRVHRLGNIFSHVHDTFLTEVCHMLRKVYPGEGRVAQESYQVKKASPDHRPDAFITGVDDKGNNGAIEVSVLRPICPQNISSASRGTAVEDLERTRRVNEYSRLGTGTIMYPFMTDIFGGLGPESAKFLASLERVRRAHGEPRCAQDRGVKWGETWKRRLSMSLAKVCAKTIRNRGQVEQSGIGPATRPSVFVGQRFP